MLLYLPEDGAGLFPPESYDRCGEPSGGLAGAAPRVIKGGWAQEFAWSRKHVPTAELHVVQEHAPERQLHTEPLPSS